jgi:uncharacterized protein YdeI (YjbR/CyaY-like superfamily)
MSKLDDYFEALPQWKEEMLELRKIIQKSPLKEELKWKQACYTDQGKNIAIIGGFKHYFVLSFFKGALLSDPDGLLEFAGNNSRSAKVLKFTSLSDLNKHQSAILHFIKEAISIEEQGLKVTPIQETSIEIPKELLQHFQQDPALKSAFTQLTPGRQRAYCMHFASPKNETTRHARIEKSTPRILAGKGMNDCICGLSKRMPSCDGSHKQIQKDA